MFTELKKCWQQIQSVYEIRQNIQNFTEFQIHIRPRIYKMSKDPKFEHPEICQLIENIVPAINKMVTDIIPGGILNLLYKLIKFHRY